MNWTSARVPLWHVDCAEFHRAGGPFEIRDVVTVEQQRFVEMFAARHNLIKKHIGTSVVLEHASRAKPGRPATSDSSSDRSLSS